MSAIKDPEMETEFSVPPPVPSTCIPNVVKFGRALLLLERLEKESLIGAIPAFKQAIKDLREIRESIQNASLPGLASKEKDGRRGTQSEVVEFCLSLTLTKEDGEWFYFKCEGNDWKNAGKAIVSWKMTCRAWQRAHYFPSQKVQKNGCVDGKPSGADKMIHQKEYERIIERIRVIRNSYDSHNEMRASDREEIHRLSLRKNELKTILGISI